MKIIVVRLKKSGVVESFFYWWFMFRIDIFVVLLEILNNLCENRRLFIEDIRIVCVRNVLKI